MGAEQVYCAFGKGCCSLVGRACGTLGSSSDAIAAIQKQMMLVPLASSGDLADTGDESVTICRDAAESILGLLTVLQSIGDVLEDVRATFEEFAKAVQVIVDKVR